jgi:hypothetical protein
MTFSVTIDIQKLNMTSEHQLPLQALEWSPVECWRMGRLRRIWSEDITEAVRE